MFLGLVLRLNTPLRREVFHRTWIIGPNQSHLVCSASLPQNERTRDLFSNFSENKSAHLGEFPKPTNRMTIYRIYAAIPFQEEIPLADKLQGHYSF